MARNIACGPLKLTLDGPAGPAKFEATDCEGPQKYDIESNDPWSFLHILIPVFLYNRVI